MRGLPLPVRCVFFTQMPTSFDRPVVDNKDVLQLLADLADKFPVRRVRQIGVAILFAGKCHDVRMAESLVLALRAVVDAALEVDDRRNSMFEAVKCLVDFVHVPCRDALTESKVDVMPQQASFCRKLASGFQHSNSDESIAFIRKMDTVRGQDSLFHVGNVVVLQVVDECFAKIQQPGTRFRRDLPTDSRIVIEHPIQVVAGVMSFANHTGSCQDDASPRVLTSADQAAKPGFIAADIRALIAQ